MKFKCKAIALLFVLISSIPCLAQIQPSAYRVGISANLPFVYNYTDTFSARTGWGAWGNVDLGINKHLRFTPGLAYNNFGYNQEYFSDSGIAQRRKITEHYFDVIAELNYLPTPKANSTRINFGLGVSFLGDRVTDQPDILDRNITQRTIDNKKIFTPNFIAHAGINASLSKHIDLGIQYTLSMPHKIFPRDVSGRLGTFQIKLSYSILPNQIKKTEEFDDPKQGSSQSSQFNKDSLIIIVRLKENTRRINKLIENGFRIDAGEEKKKTFKNNMAIVEAFKEKFTLLPVYYFYDTDSKITLEEGFTGYLLNEKLERDSSYILPQKEYLIAEFNRRFNEVTQTSGMYGLVIYNNKFKNIPEPFPAFTSNAYGFLSKKEVINKFQKRLYKYLKQ